MIAQDTPISDSVTTMLVEQELDYLQLLGSRCTGRGRVVELGCFLGGSSVALLRGLDAGGRPYEPVISYDAFEVPPDVDDRFASWLSQYGLRPGERFRRAFEGAIEPWNDRVTVREGWIPGDADAEAQRALYPEQEPIELLFVDIAKAWGVHLSVLRAFGTHLSEGSVLVQQDFFDLQTPWIPLHMWQLRDVLEPLDALLPSPTCSFRCTRPVGPMLDELWNDSIDAGIVEQAWDRIIEYWGEIIGPDAAELFHGHAFQLAVMQGRHTDAVRHGRAYEAWSRSAHSDGSYFSTCWHDLLEASADSLDAHGASAQSLRELIAESLARGSRSDLPSPDRRVTWCPEPIRQSVWAYVLQRVESAGFDRVVLCGAGRHTRWLLDAFGDDIRQRVSVIIDENPPGTDLSGIPICAAGAFTPAPGERTVVLPSSDAYEGTLLTKLHARFGQDPSVIIERVYSHPSVADLIQTQWRYQPECVPCSTYRPARDGHRVRDHAPHHRRSLGMPTDRVWIEELLAAFEVPEWCVDDTDASECAFVWDLMEAVRPQRVLELGTGAGLLTAMTLHGLDRFCPSSSVLTTTDTNRRGCLGTQGTTGGVIGAMAGGLLDRVHTYAAIGSAESAVLFEHDEIDLVIIGADPMQASPVLDLVSLLYALRAGAWVILRGLHKQGAGGAGRLHHAWPFEKLNDTAGSRIGAVRMPHDRDQARRVLLGLLCELHDTEHAGDQRSRAARAVLSGAGSS